MRHVKKTLETKSKVKREGRHERKMEQNVTKGVQRKLGARRRRKKCDTR